MTERLSDERLAELRHVAWVGGSWTKIARDLRALVDEVRERRRLTSRHDQIQRELDDYRAASRPSDGERGV